MDFGLSDDQRLLQETVSRFVADRYALDQNLTSTRCAYPPTSKPPPPLAIMFVEIVAAMCGDWLLRFLFYRLSRLNVCENVPAGLPDLFYTDWSTDRPTDWSTDRSTEK
mgnify:CR=1 FL=1